MKTKFTDEQIKLFYDQAKHFTTLNASAIVALIAFFNKQANGHVFFILALIAFIVSIVAASMGQISAIRMLDENPTIVKDFQNSNVCAWLAFALGLACLVFFAGFNSF